MKSNEYITCLQIKHEGIPQRCRFGLPIPKAYLNKNKGIEFQLNGNKIECSAEPTGYWADGSVRWLYCECIANESGELAFRIVNSDSNSLAQVFTSQCSVPKDSHLFKTDDIESIIKINAKISQQENNTNFVKRAHIITQSLFSKTHCIEGEGYTINTTFKFCCRIIECVKTNEIDIEFRVHNPSAAAHEGDTWDLGDAKSIIFENLCLSFNPTEKCSFSLHIEDKKSARCEKQIFNNQKIELYQHSSGGDNWQSPVHWDESKNSTVTQNGFTLSNDDNETTIQGLRAEPVVVIADQKSALGIQLCEFWQNFPVSIEWANNTCSLNLFPCRTELQGGESKTWRLRIVKCDKSYTDNELSTWKNSSAKVLYKPDYLNICGVMPHLLFNDHTGPLQCIIDLGVKGKQSFFEKREQIDEYGWRNYGELYADHEAVYAKENEIFVSHYNNQYDPLLGLTIQYLHSGKDNLLALIKPLSQHIQDIDIYDTNEDKAEYNHGLMWHTDHYLSAETCTHRSNSKHHQHAYEGFLGGGGPGGQHCYTTGLLLQYRFFADERAKSKVINLCNWVRNFYNGSHSILDRTFRLLTIDIKKDALTNIGRKTAAFKYPLDRGIANYIIALLDSFDIAEDKKLLAEASNVIRNTVHPSEDLSKRDLANIEENWFYTVFLQAVVRFLFVKESVGQIDNDYWYARYCLINFGKWIFEQERYYLDTPEVLEFPNDTWCAQDIRKANLLYYCFYFSKEPDVEYLTKADQYYAYIANKLKNSNEAHFTRILAILMQNDGVYQKFKNRDFPNSNVGIVSKVSFSEIDWGRPPTYSLVRIFMNYVKDCMKILKGFSIKTEFNWLKIRLRRL